MNVNLRGIGMNGTEVANGLNEPSLQRILDLFQIPDNVGDNDPTTTVFPAQPVKPNDEVTGERFLKAGDGNVSIQLLSIFDNLKSPSLDFGYYNPGSPTEKTQLFSDPQADAQSVDPTPVGNTTFDPGSSMFGLYGIFPAFTNRAVYTEDSLNTWEPVVANRTKVRFYPLKNADGSVVPNAYVFAFEEYDKAYDQNDVVGIIRNVKIAPAGPEIGLDNADGAPADNHLVFNRIQNLDPRVPNVTHDTSTLTIHNTGSSALNITSMVLSGPFTLRQRRKPHLDRCRCIGERADQIHRRRHRFGQHHQRHAHHQLQRLRRTRDRRHAFRHLAEIFRAGSQRRLW